MHRDTHTGFDMEKCFAAYRDRYEALLGMYYPAHKSTGFTERNQSVNFAAAVESVYRTAFTWYEAPIGNTRQEHLDAVIFVPEISSVVIVEAKRFSNVSKKLGELARDIRRICDRQNRHTVCQGLKPAYESCADNAYGVILADIWPNDTSEKGRIYDAWHSKTFFDAYQSRLSDANDAIGAIESAAWFDHAHVFHDLSRYCLLALMLRLS